MNIGYLHNDSWPIKDGSSIQSWQLFSNLRKYHNIFSTVHCPFPDVYRSYNNKFDLVRFVNQIDVLFIIIDGVFDFYNEKFTLFSLLKKQKLPVIWLINAPLSESNISPGNQNNYTSLFQQKMRSFFALCVDVGICVSKEIQNYAITSLKIKNTCVIPNGSDPQLFNPKQSKTTVLDSLDGYFKVFWTGGGTYPWQALDLIIRVANKFQTIDKKVLFILITDTTWNQIPLLDNVLVLNQVKYQEMPIWLKNADVCLCLYHSDIIPGYTFYNSPLKLFDYMSMAKPIIGSNLGQISQVIKHNHNGLLTDNSVTDIVKKILFVKNNKLFAKKMGIRSRELIKTEYNWETISKKIERIMINLIEK